MFETTDLKASRVLSQSRYLIARDSFVTKVIIKSQSFASEEWKAMLEWLEVCSGDQAWPDLSTLKNI